MRKHNYFHIGISVLLILSSILSGCGIKNSMEESESGANEQTISQQTLNPTVSINYQADPEDFSLILKDGDNQIAVSGQSPKRTVSDFRESDTETFWRYPEEQISVSIKPQENYLSVTITSETDDDNEFSWPNISADTDYIPFGEGKRIPADDLIWQNYLNAQEFSVLEQLSMPFWITEAGDYSVLFIMENPYRTQLNFSANPDIAFSVSHEYPQIDDVKENRFRIYLTDSNPVSAAKLYRSYVNERGDFKTLEQKAAENPDIRKLYGAPFIYLWGEFLISPDDIDWKAFRQAADSPLTVYLSSFAGSQENGSEFTAALEEIKKQDYVAEYQKNTVCSYLSQLLKRGDFWDPAVFTQHSPAMTQLLAKGYENLTETEKIQVKKEALAVNWPEIFTDAKQWTDSGTTELLQGLKESGIDRAWIGLNSWEQAYAKPELVEKAAAQGYLIGSYDSYHSIHEPGKEQWITAQFEDTALYEKATVTDKNGEKVGGFQNVGRKLNPVLAFPAVEARMEDIMSNSLPFNSWFIDCDANGEIYDDYSPSNHATQEEDLAARL